MSQPIQILLVDDHPVVRRGMLQIIADDRELEVVAEAGGGDEALELLARHAIDVVVTDFDMPGMNGLQLASGLLDRDPPVPVILLTMHENEQLFNEAIDRGISGYLLKDEAVDTITEGIKAAARGESYVSPSLSKYIMRRSQRSRDLQKKNTGLSSLTPTEREVLRRVAENKSSKEIASELGVSHRTITTHRNNISQKLGLTGKHPLLNFALANKSAILSLGE